MSEILHLADTHIGTRQYGLAERRADFSAAFLQAVELAIAEQVRAVVHAGDLFDSRNPSTEDLRDALSGLLRLREAGVPFLGIVGNHEQKRGVQWLDLFAALGLAVHLGPEPYPLEGTRIYGLDYSGRRELELPRLSGGVLVAHQLLDRIATVSGELKSAQLLDCGAELILLGDYHEHQSWLERGVLITYPGSTERWRASERSPRGVSLIDLETKRLTRRNLQTRPFVYIEADEDPLRRLKGEEVRGAVVCVYRGAGWKPEEIEEEARSRGALAVQFLEPGPAAPLAEEVELSGAQLEFLDLEETLAQELARLGLSREGQEIEAIIRDERIPDSNVDAEVTRLLESWQGR
ncbi:MAG: DNA repair exonuclease [Candidatus Acetothermia bacterium]|jgi:DNA repair exonuclease SbcCD nuclease subunit|nr:DNA repair exonuclease [Candidatus Acetothermia bacterium]MDH7505565.1 DNA repair exonuclease [Candidatus Acetothermia bacterium]